jgi:chemosensory pili system protein ChpA (sensor histidine kinase/response regulator)
MVTSRTGEKHRARAIELGVNDYLGKPYQEVEMLEAIQNLLGDDYNQPRSGRVRH